MIDTRFRYVQLLENKVRELENAMRQDKGGSLSVEKVCIELLGLCISSHDDDLES